MFSWVDVESLGVAWAMLVRASVLVAHLVIKGAHLLSPIFLHCVLILIVKSPNWSIRGLKTTSSFLFELSLQRQAFSLEDIKRHTPVKRQHINQYQADSREQGADHDLLNVYQ